MQIALKLITRNNIYHFLILRTHVKILLYMIIVVYLLGQKISATRLPRTSLGITDSWHEVSLNVGQHCGNGIPIHEV